jgi:hypothetical protein
MTINPEAWRRILKDMRCIVLLEPKVILPLVPVDPRTLSLSA